MPKRCQPARAYFKEEHFCPVAMRTKCTSVFFSHLRGRVFITQFEVFNVRCSLRPNERRAACTLKELPNRLLVALRSKQGQLVAKWVIWNGKALVEAKPVFGLALRRVWSPKGAST
jgi:hypothetical protein